MDGCGASIYLFLRGSLWALALGAGSRARAVQPVTEWLFFTDNFVVASSTTVEP